MIYSLVKELYKAGFPKEYLLFKIEPKGPPYRFPTLSELIEACGDRFGSLTRNQRGVWYTASPFGEGKNAYELAISDEYSTPEEAVARLWLALNKK